MNSEHIKNFNEICTRLIFSIFSQHFTQSETYTPEPVPSFPSKYMIQIGLRNRSFQLSMILGIPQKSSEMILTKIMDLPKDESERNELTKSAFGELCNTIACDFAILGVTVSDFGKLLPTPPLVWMTEKGIPDFIKGDGLSGQLCSADPDQEYTLYTHLSSVLIPAVSGRQEKGNWNPTLSLSIYDPHSFDHNDDT